VNREGGGTRRSSLEQGNCNGEDTESEHFLCGPCLPCGDWKENLLFVYGDSVSSILLLFGHQIDVDLE
jgi:hypothetical protein